MSDPTAEWVLPPGVEIDPPSRRLTLNGRNLLVASAMEDCGPGSTMWFDILCGENGWWLSLSIDPYEGTMYALSPDWNNYDAVIGTPDMTAQDVLDFVTFTSHRFDSPPPWPTDDESGPFMGGTTPTWGGWDRVA